MGRVRHRQRDAALSLERPDLDAGEVLPHGGSLTALSVLGPDDVWAFGGTGSTGTDGVFHFNGRTWTEVSVTLEGGSALSNHNVWAFNGTEVEHYNGRS